MIVHLERSKERLPQVKHLETILPTPVSVLNAVDGRDSSVKFSNYAKNSYSPRYPFELSPAEIATFLSHRECWNRIIAMKADYALIVEDDVELDPNLFDELFRRAQKVLKQGDYLRIPFKSREKSSKVILNEDFKIFEPSVIGLGMQCQLVTKEAAKRLLKASESFDRPVDTFIQMRWLHNVRVISCAPTGVSEVSQSLGGSTIQGILSLRQKFNREILRPLYRSKVWLWSKKSR